MSVIEVNKAIFEWEAFLHGVVYSRILSLLHDLGEVTHFSRKHLINI